MFIHTIEVGRSLNARSMRHLIRAQTWFNQQKLLAFPNSLSVEIKSRRYPFSGVREAILRRSSSSSSHFFLSLILNLRSLETGQYSIDLFDPTTAAALQSVQNSFVAALNAFTPGMMHPGLSRWSTRTVHYAIDVQTLHVAEYVRLMNRARLQASFDPPLAQPGSFYVSSSTGDVKLNFYDKTDQLNRERHFTGLGALLLQARNRLRIEVQCQGDKLQHILRSQSPCSTGLSPQTFLDSVVANAVLQDYYRRTIGYSDFHSLQQALSLIQAGPGRTDRKTKLSDFARLLDQYDTVGEAMQCFIDGAALSVSGTTVQGSKRSLDNYLRRYLPNLNINPILIPAQMNLSMLPNPMPAQYRIP